MGNWRYIGEGGGPLKDDFGGILVANDTPKLKFNFTMSIQYAGMSAEKGEDDPYQIAFGIKQITRPAPNMIYEDVNFYNFISTNKDIEFSGL